MKKVIFLLFVLNSFLFSYDSPNPATDKLVQLSYTANTCLADISHPINTYFYQDSNHATCLKYTPTIYTSASCPDGKKYNKYSYAVSINYQCPSGQEIINGACAVPPTCTSPQIWNSSTDTCVAPPAPDADGDGTPDKCDYDHPNFANLDCDGDTIPNSTDDNIDGDDALNVNDLDSNNDGIPDSTQKGSPHYNANCQGADLSRDYVIQGVSYPKATYYSRGVMWISQCNALVNTTDIDSSFSAYDKNPECKSFYCFVHPVKASCTYAPADYQPQGSSWTYKSGVDSEAKCSTYVDNVKYSSHHFAAPNLNDCPESAFCFLKRVDNAPAYVDQNMSENKTVDLNSTSQDLKPLLDAHNKTNEHLTDIKTQLVTSNKTLEDLKGVSNDILNKNESMDSSLKSLKSNSDKSLKNDLESLSTLGNIASATQKGNDINKAFSDVSTKNQVIGNEHLSSIDGKMNTNNALLTTIDATATESKDFLSSIKNFLDGKNSDGTTSDISSLTSSFASGDDLLGQITGSFSNVASSFASSTSLINQGFSYSPPSSGSSAITFNALGRSVSFDLCTSLSSISGIFYYIFYTLFMVISIRIFYKGIKVR